MYFIFVLILRASIIILLTACQFACRTVLKFCMLNIILLIECLFDFIDVYTNLHIKLRTKKRTDQ